MTDETHVKKSIKGYQIVVIILAVILGALSFLYFSQVSALKEDFRVERDTLTNQLSHIMVDFDNIRTENDTISYQLGVERGKADSLMQKLSQERSFSRTKIREYEKELGTLRTVMRGFVHQIDSLNTLNRRLIGENMEMRTRITSERLRADKAEEKADELDTKVRKGAVVRAREIYLTALSGNDREVTRAARAERLRVSFVLSANELAQPGGRNVYVRIKGPDGYVMTSNANSSFSYEGNMISFSAVREIDYQNDDLDVSLFYNGPGIVSGTYGVEVYMDGHMTGRSEVMLR